MSDEGDVVSEQPVSSGTTESTIISWALTHRLTPEQAAVFSIYLRERGRRKVNAQFLADEVGLERRAVTRVGLEARIRVLMTLVEAYREGVIDPAAPLPALFDIFDPDAWRAEAQLERNEATRATMTRGK